MPRRFSALASACLVTLTPSLLAAGCGSSSSAPAASQVSITALSSPDRPDAKAETPTTPIVSVTEATASPTTKPMKAVVTIMPLGDSITQGDNPDDPTRPQSYRGYLEQQLSAAGYQFDFVGSDQTPVVGGGDPDNEGHGGFTIGPDTSRFCDTCPPANLASNVTAWLAATTPDVVLLMAGANDLLPIETPTAQGMVRPVNPADAAAKLQALVGAIRTASPGTTVLVSSLPPMSFFAGFPTTEAAYAQLNAAASSLGTGNDEIRYVPMYETLRGSWNPDSDSLPDHLHPSSSGAAKIAQVWTTALAPVLDQLQQS